MILTGKIFLMFLDWPFLSTVKVNINWILNSPITISLTYFILKLLCTMNKSSIMTPTAERSGSLPVQELGWFKILLWILYSIIFALGITGNACVCYILHRKQTLRTVTNFFILNLAISDFIFSLSIPLEFPLIVSKFKWPYASFFCKIYTPVQTIAFSVSIFTLTAVSIIRYRAIKHPFKLQVSLSHAHYIVIGIWFLSSLLMVPHVLTLKIKPMWRRVANSVVQENVHNDFIYVFLCYPAIYNILHLHHDCQRITKKKKFWQLSFNWSLAQRDV